LGIDAGLPLPLPLFAQSEVEYPVIPSVDALVDFSNGGSGLVDSGLNINVQQTVFSGIDGRGVLEFDIGPIPDSAIITSATLELYINIITFSENDQPVLYMHGYAGNGTPEITDGQVPANLIGQSDSIPALGMISLDIDPNYIESLLAVTDYLGLLVLGDVNGTQAGFVTVEREPIIQGVAPALTIQYTIPVQSTLATYPAVDGLADFSDGGAVLVTNDDTIVVQQVGWADIDKRCILEFAIKSIPEDATITSATLELDVIIITYSEISRPALYLHGYAGNGTLEIADAQMPANLIGQSGPIMSLDILSIDLDPNYIETLLELTDYLGILAVGDVNGDLTVFAATEGG
jgi:hypothetical protein